MVATFPSHNNLYVKVKTRSQHAVLGAAKQYISGRSIIETRRPNFQSLPERLYDTSRTYNW